LSPTYILLGVINGSCSCGLSVWLAMNCHQELVASCSQKSGQTFVSLWHRLCILACYFLMPNIPFKCCSLHLSLSFVFDPLLDTNPSLEGFLHAFLQFQNYNCNEKLQWEISTSTMPLSHYIQSLKKFAPIFFFAFTNIPLIVFDVNICVCQLLMFHYLISYYFIL
jgi:hypothetical protein